MITTAAVVKDGVVVNWIKVDTDHLPEYAGCEVVVTENATIGWLYDGQTFTDPEGV